MKEKGMLSYKSLIALEISEQNIITTIDEKKKLEKMSSLNKMQTGSASKRNVEAERNLSQYTLSPFTSHFLLRCRIAWSGVG